MDASLVAKLRAIPIFAEVGDDALARIGAAVTRLHASTAIRCLAVARRDFAAILEAEPEIAVAMLPVLAERLAHLETPA